MDGTPALDDKGRKHPSLLNEREMLIEITLGLRAVQDLAESFVKSVESNPMLSKMGSMFGMGRR